MALPTPAPGLVICYAYLWRDQHGAGASEGRKDRPCVIVVAAKDEDGDALVYVAPFTHNAPTDATAVALPASVKRHLGLDSAPSWILTSELNRFIWPGYDLRPIARNRPSIFEWGFLPVEVFADVKRGVAANQKAGRLGFVGRDA